MDNDLISRSALMEKTRAIFSGVSFKHEDEAKSIIETIEALIDVAPVVDAVPVRHGRWKRIDSSVYKPAICSCCGASQFIDSNYCQNCGAKMDGRTNNA